MMGTSESGNQPQSRNHREGIEDMPAGIQWITPTDYEKAAYEFTVGAKTFRIAERIYGDFCVTSHLTDKPSRKGYWGCRVFPTLQAVEAHYKSLRGISALIA